MARGLIDKKLKVAALRLNSTAQAKKKKRVHFRIIAVGLRNLSIRIHPDNIIEPIAKNNVK
jgi:hypothetical protein